MRKKFTMLFAALLACVGVAKAQFVETSTAEAPKYYVIASYNRGGYLTLADASADATHVALEEGSYWYFEKANKEGGVHFVNKLKDGESKVYLGSNKKGSSTAAVWYVKENGVNKNGLSISSNATNLSGSCIDANNSNTGVGTWGPSASDWHGTTWVFVEAATLQDATYNPEGLIFRTRSDRYVTSVALNGTFNNSAEVNRDYQGANGLVYNNLTETVTMRAVAGEDVTASLTRDGAWTNAYVYIDYDNDGFTADIDEDGFTPAGDLVSYSFYSGDEADDTSGKNSEGTDLTGASRNTLTLPAFTAPSTPGTYRLRFKNDWNSINPNGGNANFESNGGSFIDVTLEVVSSTIDVVYTYKYNGEVKFTQTSNALVVGDEYPALNQTLPYGVTATKPAGNIAESDVVDGKVAKDIEITNSLPFVAAADYASIKNWYYIQMHSSGGTYSRYIQAMDGYIEWLDVDMNMSEADAYTWAFIGNPFDGFKLVNKSTGETKAVNSTGTGNPALGDYETGVQWIIAASSTNPTAEYFCFKYPTSNQYMNAQDGKIAFWGSRDQGSTMWVTERDLSGATELLKLIESANAMADALGESTGVGSVTSESLAALVSEIETAQAAADAKEGCIEAQVALQAAIDGLETIQPEEGVFYILKNNYTNRYMNINKTAGLIATTSVGIGEVFQFVKDNNNLYLKGVERGTYVSTALAHGWGQNSAAATTITDAMAVEIKNLGKANHVSITPVGGATLHHDTNSHNVVAWNAGVDSKSSWTIQEVETATLAELAHTVTISAVEWATLILGYDAVIPVGVKAYAVSSVDTYANLTEITGTIPAGQAVLLNGAAGDYEFKFAASAEAVATNLLKGSTVNTTVNEAAYILAAKEGVVGLYEVNLDDNNAFTNNAFKVYLPASERPEGTEAPAMFSFGRGEGTTGIEQIAGDAELVIYDLAGRRVEKMEKGIYIVNGKKVVIK